MVPDYSEFIVRLWPHLGNQEGVFWSVVYPVVVGIGLAGLAILALLTARRRKAEKLEIPKKLSFPPKALRRAMGKRSRWTLLGLEEFKGWFFRRWRPFLISEEDRGRHLQLMGPTRSGKSQLLLAIAGQDMARGRTCFFMEAKGDFSDFDHFLGLAGLTGRTADVRYFNPADPRSMSFNPIRPVPGQSSSSIANQIARAIGREPDNQGDAAYFTGLDYARIQGMVDVFLTTGKAFTLRDAYYYFEFGQCREYAFEQCPDKVLVGMARRHFSRPGQPPGHLADTSGLTSKLRPWVSGRLGELLNSYGPQIRMEDVFGRNRLAYFAIPVGDLQVLANHLGRMVISGLLSAASRRHRGDAVRSPASLILDEFPEFATPAFSSLIATVGSANIWTVFSHQDLGQLKRVTGMDKEAFASTLFSNSSGGKIFFHVPHPVDADLVARAIGTMTVVKATERSEKGMAGERMTGDKSLREVEEFIAHPNLLRSLPRGVAAVLCHGRWPGVVVAARVHGMDLRPQTTKLPCVEAMPEKGLELGLAARFDAEEEVSGRLAEPAGKP